MKIYSMTATFGKLDNQTLTLKPGLNVIQAPNEWGKSTWCAFLVNMLYGMETRVKSTKTALADKERYAPWSGAPMSGRMDLQWQGRDITIERWTKGRTPMGEFRAYETRSGVAVPELTAATCGQLLLGVERSVFLRSGFLRLSDLPVTEDDALRRRLNSLVTTGDESNTADELARKLKELKNKCRFNRSGLIPQAELERNDLLDKLGKMKQYQDTAAQLAQQQENLRLRRSALENHRQALLYGEAEENRRRIAQAQLRREEAERRLQELTAQCNGLQEKEQAQRSAQQLRRLHQDSMALDLEQQMLPPAPQKPVTAQSADETAARQRLEQAQKDSARLKVLQEKAAAGKKRRNIARFLMWLAIPVAVIVSLIVQNPLVKIAMAVVPLAGLVAFFVTSANNRDIPGQLRDLERIYGSSDGEKWVRQAENDLGAQLEYASKLAKYEEQLAVFQQKRDALMEKLQVLTQGRPISACLQEWEGIVQQWESLEEAHRSFAEAKAHAEAISAVASTVLPPEQPDELNLTMEQTRCALEELEQRQQLLHHQYGQNQGLMEALGQEEVLRRRLEQVNGRLERLYEIHAALELAQSTLADATTQLQRRFAPRISKEAQRIFSQLTRGRYDRLTISQDMSLNTGAGEESVLHTAQWRSEGTVDQMYLALRLAVSKELTPDAPLILDDALVRFDDTRHAAAMEILKAEGEERQILLFTCQTRELAYT